MKERLVSFVDQNKALFIFFSFLILAFIFFSPSYLNQNYFWDDERFIFLNPEVLQAPHWYSFWILKSEFIKSWPLGYSIFYILMKYSPINSFNFYKSLNIIFHALNAFLVYRLNKKLKFPYPFILSLIFLIHPLHVEVVSWIFQLLTILAMTFFLVSFLLLNNFLESKKYFPLVLSILFFLFSLWTKSIALLTPFLFVLVFWLCKSRFKEYLFLIPYFLISLYIGVFNIQGMKQIANQNSTLNKTSSLRDKVFSSVENNFQNIFENSKPVIKNTSEKVYFDFIYPKSETLFEHQPIKIFKQASWHYFTKLIFPTHMNFIYKDIDYGGFLTAIPIIILLIIPLFLLGIDKLILFIPVMTLVFLVPYLGVTNITFFYWSNVSDRYLYFFILVLIFSLGLLAKKYPVRKTKIIISFYCLALSAQTINYGLKFNKPIELYKEIITYRPHPVIYAALISGYDLNLDLINGEKTLNEALLKFPNDPLLTTEQFKLNNLKKYYLNNN
ncbi:MAG: hypothetical protein H7336_17025 [Bacteriovorax sp.]|nr:hypothetical protein [Bacteriovorax sp.]